MLEFSHLLVDVADHAACFAGFGNHAFNAMDEAFDDALDFHRRALARSASFAPRRQRQRNRAPDSPARAASMAAFNARRLVWSAMSRMRCSAALISTLSLPSVSAAAASSVTRPVMAVSDLADLGDGIDATDSNFLVRTGNAPDLVHFSARLHEILLVDAQVAQDAVGVHRVQLTGQRVLLMKRWLSSMALMATFMRSSECANSPGRLADMACDRRRPRIRA